jgi:hypothetical protein
MGYVAKIPDKILTIIHFLPGSRVDIIGAVNRDHLFYLDFTGCDVLKCVRSYETLFHPSREVRMGCGALDDIGGLSTVKLASVEVM